MNSDDRFHELIRRAISKARDHIETNYARRQEPCVSALMDQIEAEIKLREFDAFQREHPPWKPPRINPWGC